MAGGATAAAAGQRSAGRTCAGRPLPPGVCLTLGPPWQAGPVITVKIPKDRDGRSKQFAFVNFKHEESVPYGLRLLNGIKLYGRPMRIQFRSGTAGTLTGFIEGK